MANPEIPKDHSEIFSNHEHTPETPVQEIITGEKNKEVEGVQFTDETLVPVDEEIVHLSHSNEGEKVMEVPMFIDQKPAKTQDAITLEHLLASSGEIDPFTLTESAEDLSNS